MRTNDELGETCAHCLLHVLQQQVHAFLCWLVTATALGAAVPRLLAQCFINCAITGFADAQRIHRLHFCFGADGFCKNIVLLYACMAVKAFHLL